MKNPFVQFAFVIFAFIALTFLMAYVKPAADEPKEYTLVLGAPDKMFAKKVNDMLAEGWHLQGGVSTGERGVYIQALVK
jgi:hypothetical protein